MLLIIGREVPATILDKEIEQAGAAVPSRPVFRSCSFQISTGIPIILTEVFRSSTQSPQTSARLVSGLGHDRFFPNSVHFSRHPTIPRCTLYILTVL
jgi:hypothetical protein